MNFVRNRFRSEYLEIFSGILSLNRGFHGAKIAQIERNAKGKLVFLCICFTSLREQRPLVPRCSLSSSEAQRYNNFPTFPLRKAIFYSKESGSLGVFFLRRSAPRLLNSCVPLVASVSFVAERLHSLDKNVRRGKNQMLIFAAVGFLRSFGSKRPQVERQIRPNGKCRFWGRYYCLCG